MEHNVPTTDDKLASLIGSRICHDLISPIGAVTNGLELLELTGMPRGPEVDLVTQSALNAAARIRFFRLAFGTGSEEQRVASAEIREILDAAFAGGRVSVQWNASDPCTRSEAKAVLLAVMCVETALPAGGKIEVLHLDDVWNIGAAGPRIKLEGDHWRALVGQIAGRDVAPAAVEFALLPDAAALIRRRIELDRSDQSVLLRLVP